MGAIMNKTVLIAGGCGLLGSEFSKTLRENYKVVILDLSNKINYLNRRGDEFNENYVGYNVDITNENDVLLITKHIYTIFGSIDILINCAAINPIPKEGEDNSFENYTLKRWTDTLEINLSGSFILSKECIKYMLKNSNEGFKGTIINISSDLGIITSDQDIYENGYIKPPDYGVSKAGIIQLTKYMAAYYRDKIKSVCLAPGSIYNGQSETLVKNLERRIPIGRLARSNEYNEAIKFLCSSGSDYFQGQTLVMDGGRTII